MNIQLIRETESQNDGSNINLYWNKQIGAWCAYGYSAYGLRLFDKRQGYMNLRSYSDCLQMPCTVTSGESKVSGYLYTELYCSGCCCNTQLR